LASGGDSAGNISDPLLDLLRELGATDREFTAGDRLAEDLHLDSLAMVQLQSALETRFGLELDDTAWGQVKTVGDLRGLLQTRRPGEVPADAATPVGSPVERRLSAVPTPVIPSQRERIVFPRWPWWPVVRLLRTVFLEVVMRPLLWLVLGPRIVRPVLLAQPSLLIANHLTAFDVPVILYALSARDREHMAVAMSGQLLTGWRRGKAARHRMVALLTPIAYWLVTAFFNVFPLPRSAGLRQSFAHAGQALDQGYHVLVFPEGGRSRDGQLQPFEPGIGLLAQESQVPVQPIFIEGLGLREGGKWPKRGEVAVRLGEPLIMFVGEEPQAFTRRLQAAVIALGRS
jgi:long-chain acyl-CoA synthetase